MNTNNKYVITINRELGSGGRTVGRKLADFSKHYKSDTVCPLSR